MAVRGLGNIVDGAPVKVKKHKKFLLDILIGALHDMFSSEVIGESMKALAKVLKELKEKDIGSSFKDLTQQIRTYFDDEDDALRSVAFVLFGILARMTTKKRKAYFAEQLMSDPMVREKKLLKSVLRLLEERSQDRNSIVRQMAVRGLGNIVDGAPVKVKKHKKFLLDILIGALHDMFSSEVIGESMKALAKVLKELKEKDIGSSFKDLTQQIRTYFDDEDDALRSVAFVLFGILARMTTKKWKAYFAEQVRKSWVTLLLHLQDPSPKVSMECRATFHLCFPFLGLKRLRHAINKHLE
ncbi:protein maestro-like [Pangshura tecta]